MLAGTPTQSPRGSPLSTAQTESWAVLAPEHSRALQLAQHPPLWASKPPQLLLRQAPPSFSPSPSAATKTRPDLGLPLPPTAGSSQASPLASLSTQMPCAKTTVLVS